jgi:peptidoglycan/LPS O-acetylase OafA/YrhL
LNPATPAIRIGGMAKPVLELDLRSLDCLRGVLAIYVLAGHARWLLWTGHTNWVQLSHAPWANVMAYTSAGLRFGHEAVLVFFVLSGFFIHLRAAQAMASGDDAKFNTRKYAVRRVHRLMPPYAAALLMTVAIDALGRHLWPSLYEGRTGDAVLDRFFVRSGYGWEAVVPAICLLPSSLDITFGSNGPLWSLAYEAVYYAIYPLWLPLRQRLGLAIACGVGLGVAVGLTQFPVQSFFTDVFSHWYLWIAGAALAELMCRAAASSKDQAERVAVVCALGLFGLNVWPIAGIIGSAAMGIGMVLLFGKLLSRGINVRLMRLTEWIGVRSYSIYICHFPILVAISAWCFAVNGSLPASGWLAVVGGLLALAVGLGSFEICERHFLHARLGWSNSAPPSHAAP